MPQEIFQQHFERDGKPRDRLEARFLQPIQTENRVRLVANLQLRRRVETIQGLLWHRDLLDYSGYFYNYLNPRRFSKSGAYLSAWKLKYVFTLDSPELNAPYCRRFPAGKSK